MRLINPSLAASFLSCVVLAGFGMLGIPYAFALPQECAEPFPLDEVEPGQQAQGWTVAHGQEPEPFRVEVLGVLQDGVALGRDMIVVEISDEPGSTMVERAGGIWAGMSGSPVYVGDRLLGAIAWSFSLGPSPVGGVTPAEDMLEVLGIDDPAGELNATTHETAVEVPASLRPLLAERAGLSELDVVSLERLPLAFSVSGLNARWRARVQDGLERAGVSAVVTPTSTTSRQEGPITVRPVPGGNFAGLLALGDFSAGSVGTTTYVCGDRALAFGHSLRLFGSTVLSANDAEAITIVTDPTTGPSKLANLGHAFGTLDQDRSVAIAATLGTPPPLIKIRSVVKAPHLERRRKGTSWTPSSQLVPEIATFHLVTNLLSVFDEEGDGWSRVEWRVFGRRADGEDWSLHRSNRYASRFDIAFGSITELLNQLASIEANPFEDVTFRRVKLRARALTDFRIYRLESFTILRGGEPVSETNEIRSGDALLLDVVLRSEDHTLVTAGLALRVPDDAVGSAVIRVGGGSGFANAAATDACLFNHGECADGDEDSFQDLLDDLASAPKYNDLVATLELFDGVDDGPAVFASRRFTRVVDGVMQQNVEIVAPPGG